MSKKSILQANPYLRNAAQRKEMLSQSVVSSTAIEGVRVQKRSAGAGKFVSKGLSSRSLSKPR